jgi:DNA repair exonuclease SbcCD nuclease subunit
MRTFTTNNGKVAIITDTHLGARSDSMVFHDYFLRFFEQVLFPWLIENNVKILIHLGDFTDRRKYINFYTLNIVRTRIMARLKELGILVIVTVGNHDTFFKNTNEVNSMQELFSDMENIMVLTEPEEVLFDETKVLLMPWMNTANMEQSLAAIKNTDAKILMGHLELKGFIMQRGQKAEHGLDPEIFNKFNLVCSGHYHHKSDEGNIHYLGAPYEMTFADVNDPRGFHVWEPGKDNVEFIQNPYRMFHKLFYDDKNKELGTLLKRLTEKYSGTYVKVIVANRTNPYYFEKYLEKLFSLNPADVKIEEDLSLNESDTEVVVDMAEDTLTILNKYVDGLEIDSDKAKIKEELRLLYVEASHMDR